MNNRDIILLILIALFNLLFMHYSIFMSCDVERQIDNTIYVDNLFVVLCEVLLLFFVLSVPTKRNVRLAAFLSSLITLLWSFCNVVYARFCAFLFFHSASCIWILAVSASMIWQSCRVAGVATTRPRNPFLYSSGRSPVWSMWACVSTRKSILEGGTGRSAFS